MENLNNLNLNNAGAGGGGAALLLMCLSSSLSSSGSFLYAGAAQSAMESRAFVTSRNANASKTAKQLDLDADEIRREMTALYESICVLPPKDGKCPAATRVGSNGCCEYTDPRKQSKGEQILETVKTIGKDVLMSYLLDRMIVVAAKLSKAAARVALKAGAKIAAKVGAKVAAKIAIKMATRFAAKLAITSKCGIYCIIAQIAFEVISMALDITDPLGYNTFQPNEASINIRNIIDIEVEKLSKEGDERIDYPNTFPLSIAFPQHDAGFMDALTEKFLPDTLELLDEASMSKFIESMLSGSDVSNELSDKIADAFDLLLSKKHKERDLAIYQFYRRKGLGLQIEHVPFMSTPRRVGVTLSKYGADVYNDKMKSLHLKFSNPYDVLPAERIPKDYIPMVAMYTDTYRVMNTASPGTKEKPNVIERKLSQKVTLGMPYGMLVTHCSIGMQGAHSQRINPAVYGVKFNNSTGYCDFTKEYCKRFGLDYKNNDCTLNKGQEFAEFIFGTTITRQVKDEFQNRADAWASGDPGQIAIATAFTMADFATFGLATGLRVFGQMMYNDLKGSYGRGAGQSMVCRQGYEQKGAICYPKCRDGYKSSALECEGVCPEGSRDTGLTCIQGIHSYIPRNKCSNPIKSCFYEVAPCREGMIYRGSTCNAACLPDFTFRSGAAGSAFCDKPRNRYSRAGNGKPLDSCPPGMEKDGALCYKQCRAGFRGDGPLCKVADPGKPATAYDIAK